MHNVFPPCRSLPGSESFLELSLQSDIQEPSESRGQRCTTRPFPLGAGRRNRDPAWAEGLLSLSERIMLRMETETCLTSKPGRSWEPPRRPLRTLSGRPFLLYCYTFPARKTRNVVLVPPATSAKGGLGKVWLVLFITENLSAKICWVPSASLFFRYQDIFPNYNNRLTSKPSCSAIFCKAMWKGI